MAATSTRIRVSVVVPVSMEAAWPKVRMLDMAKLFRASVAMCDLVHGVAHDQGPLSSCLWGVSWPTPSQLSPCVPMYPRGPLLLPRSPVPVGCTKKACFRSGTERTFRILGLCGAYTVHASAPSLCHNLRCFVPSIHCVGCVYGQTRTTRSGGRQTPHPRRARAHPEWTASPFALSRYVCCDAS